MALALNTVHQGDCVEKLHQLKSGSIDLVFADPPFNIGYKYDVYDDRQTAEDYLDWSRQWIDGVFHCLKPDGTFWLAIGDEFAAELKIAAQDTGFHCRSWVIWYYTFGVNCKYGFSRSHTHLFHLVKDPQRFTFNDANPAVRVPSARQLVYADVRANPKGRLPDNTWILRPQDLPNRFSMDHDTWYFPRVAGTFKEREGFHGCQMPEQLLGRIIRISSNPAEVVLDPFTGSGTTVTVAKKLGRQWIGFELSKDYVKHVGKRLAEIHVGDPLNGAADPLKSAPTTKNGKVPRIPPSSPARRGARHGKAAKIRDEIVTAVVAAYKATHHGFSADYLLADPDRNAEFVERCKWLGVPGEPVIWNQTLLRVRKQGQLPKTGRAPRRIPFKDMDTYSHASEVALHLLSVEFDVTLDEILCDPQLAAKFDQIATEFATTDQTPFDYRWAALTLRKRAKLAKRKAARYQDRLSKSLPPVKQLEEIDRQKCTQPGVYALLGGHDRLLYVGETFDMGRRIEQTAAASGWIDLEPNFVRLFPEAATGLLGLKSVLIQRLNPALNSQLLFPHLVAL